MLELRIHNTLSKEKELFIPCDPKHVRMYTCGPTVYNYAHIGNARPAVISDLLVRVLRVLYPKGQPLVLEIFCFLGPFQTVCDFQ